ncbi:MAG: hypothetical protein DRQ46_00530 [Gammaproteobacteria bacterium]|nr:MAG: hypothetical protein DRQ46_00530 [Gammaproteobacteria bacterium]
MTRTQLLTAINNRDVLQNRYDYLLVRDEVLDDVVPAYFPGADSDVTWEQYVRGHIIETDICESSGGIDYPLVIISLGVPDDDHKNRHNEFPSVYYYLWIDYFGVESLVLESELGEYIENIEPE